LVETGVFRASDGYRFYYRHYRPTGGPRARLVIVHGIRSHGGWYGRSSAAFASAGIEVFFLDRRGAGMNTTHRGDTPSFRRLLDDVAEFVQFVRQEEAYLPLFLCGISWGGKLAAGISYRKPGLVDGLILLCPGLAPKVAPAFLQRVRIAIARVFRPSRLFPVPLNEPDLFTSSPGWQKYIDNEPLGLRTATARFLFSSFSFDLYLRRAGKHVTRPTFLALASNDQIIDNALTRAFVQRFPVSVEVKEYTNAHHTLEFESDSNPWLSDVTSWIEARLSG
jgi:alpha-beta hydrolase superfamily lysophospholipase